ncbi:MAG: hypothetical protein IJX82_04890 [Clostridia bacterium]|nr:hypothetical protein [Clostridia bacterium]
MHKVYENDDLMMLFKKRYCHCCGGVLQTRKNERIVRKGDPNHKVYCTVGTKYKPYGDILVIGKEYHCPSCDKTFSCDEQGKVMEAQRYYQKKIVTDEELCQAYKSEILVSLKNILKLRWTLLIPVVGSLICMFYIFNGKLSEKTERNDGYNLLLSSILVFIGVAIAVKIVLSMFNNIHFINNYKTIFMLMPSLLSFNVPALWYINHKFK